MRFFTLIAALFAPLCAQAVVMFTNSAYDNIIPGVPFTLTWSGDGTPVTIALLNGPNSMLKRVGVITSGASGSSYTWTPPSTLPESFYALSIRQSGLTNYSPRFLIASASAGIRQMPTRTHSLPISSPSTDAGLVATGGYHPPFPTSSVISHFNATSTASGARFFYTGTGAPVVTGTNTYVVFAGPSGQRTPIGTVDMGTVPIGTVAPSSFTGGAMRLGGFGLGCSVAAVFAGTVLVGWAF